jgi:hypothetical protein
LCINNLRQIEAAKEQFALANNKPGGYQLTPEDIVRVNSYIKGGGPTCPLGGTYTYGKIGQHPTCSLGNAKGHALP